MYIYENLLSYILLILFINIFTLPKLMLLYIDIRCGMIAMKQIFIRDQMTFKFTARDDRHQTMSKIRSA